MITAPRPDAVAAGVADLKRRMQLRIDAGAAYVERSAAAMAACSGEMAERFWNGGTLFVIGAGAGATDAQHNAVEYVHPVLPGCRALPALALTPDSGAADAVWDRPLRALARPVDMLLVFAEPDDAAAERALATAGESGVLTIAVVAGESAGALEAIHLFVTGSADPLIGQELQLASYHVLWELIHIVLNHRGTVTAPAMEVTP